MRDPVLREHPAVCRDEAAPEQNPRYDLRWVTKPSSTTVPLACHAWEQEPE